MSHPQPLPPGPGQESVWQYPRPPRLEPCGKHLMVMFRGITIASTHRGYRVLETSHPPVYYFPPQDVVQDVLEYSPQTSYCEWKGLAQYCSVVVGDHRADLCAWFYPNPTPRFQAIGDYIAFYAAPMDGCFVDGEKVQPQPGGFYGGWITADLVGPFKGSPGSWGW